jgi:hypothetical protein
VRAGRSPLCPADRPVGAIATVVRTFATSLEQYRPAVFALVQLLINGLLLVREDRTLKLDLIHGLERTLVQAVASALRALPEPTGACPSCELWWPRPEVCAQSPTF